MKFPVKFVIAVCVLLVGLAGLIVCVVPHYGVEKVVYQYIDAAQDGDVEEMMECTAVSQLAGAFGGLDVSGMMGSVSPESVIRDTFGIPGDATLVSVDTLGCTVEEGNTFYGAGYRVRALIKTVYTDVEGAEQTRITEKSFSVMDTGEGYKICG